MNKALEKIEKEIKKIEDEEQREAAQKRLLDIAKVYDGEDEVVSWETIKKEINPNEFRIFSGWSGLDDLLKGFRLQQLIVLSAATKSGKTSLAVDLTSRLAEHNPLWFPFEESAEELIRKFQERGEEPPHAYSPLSMMGGTTQWIESKIVESIAKYNTKVVFIDHLDFVVPFNTDNHSLRMAQAMRELKGLAKKWHVVIFLICHLVKTKMDTQPTLEDLRGSAAIAQEADTVILMWREARREGREMVITDNVNVSVQANRRHGKTGNVKMIFKDGRFLEQDWSLTAVDKDFHDF